MPDHKPRADPIGKYLFFLLFKRRHFSSLGLQPSDHDFLSHWSPSSIILATTLMGMTSKYTLSSLIFLLRFSFAFLLLVISLSVSQWPSHSTSSKPWSFLWHFYGPSHLSLKLISYEFFRSFAKYTT